MDAIIALEAHKQFLNGPPGHRLYNSFLSGRSLAVAQHLNALVIGAKPGNGGVVTSLELGEGDPMQIDPRDLPFPLAAAPPEVVFEILLDVLDMRNLLDYVRDPTLLYLRTPEQGRSARWKEGHRRARLGKIRRRRQAIANRARDLLFTFRSLRASSQLFLDTVMDASFRIRLYQRWYQFGSRRDAPVRSEKEAEDLPIPPLRPRRELGLEPEAKRKKEEPTEDGGMDVSWYMTLLYDAILYEHLLAVTASAVRIQMAPPDLYAKFRDVQKNMPMQGRADPEHTAIHKSFNAVLAGNLEDLMMNDMAEPGSARLVYDQWWELTVLGKAVVFPGSELMRSTLPGQNPWYALDRWWWLALVRRAVQRSTVFRIPFHSVSGARYWHASDWVVRPIIAIRGDDKLLLFDTYHVGQPTQGRMNELDMTPIKFSASRPVSIDLRGVLLADKAATERWLSDRLAYVRALPGLGVRTVSLLAVKRVAQRSRQAGAFDPQAPRGMVDRTPGADAPGTLTLLLETPGMLTPESDLVDPTQVIRAPDAVPPGWVGIRAIKIRSKREEKGEEEEEGPSWRGTFQPWQRAPGEP